MRRKGVSCSICVFYRCLLEEPCPFQDKEDVVNIVWTFRFHGQETIVFVVDGRLPMVDVDRDILYALA